MSDGAEILVTLGVAAMIVSGFLVATRPQRDREMKELIPTGRVVILTDQEGRQYAVRHHLGGLYRIDPVIQGGRK